MGLLDGKVALITGAARGQGRSHAVTSAREGASVILVDIAAQIETVPYPMARVEDLEETVRQVQAVGGRALSIVADVRSQEQMDDVVARGLGEFGHIDILIANAAVWSVAPFWEMTEQAWDAVLAVNVTGVWKSAKAVAPHMIERRSGSIVVISSVNGIEPGMNTAQYVTAKHGVLGLMKNMALELAPHGIRCNAICPGAILTPMGSNQAIWDMVNGGPGGTEANLKGRMHHYGALRGVGFLPPDTIANTALYLNSDLAAHLTGTTIPVEAGHLLLAGFNHNPVRDPEHVDK